MSAIDLREQLYSRPTGEQALDHVRAARALADRFFEVVTAFAGAWFQDRRHHEPWMFYYKGRLTRVGLMLVCDLDEPHAVLTPWGPWVFAGSGSRPAGLTFLDNLSFTRGLTLGTAIVAADNDRNHFYPVLAVGGIRLPDPHMYVFAGTYFRAEAPDELKQEWQQLYAGTAGT